MKRNFRIQQSVLMLALAAAYPVLGYGAAGTTQFTAGDVTVKRGNAAPAPLAKGTEVESGDSIITGSRGVAQLKFSDGGYVAIQPNSQFDLTRYTDKGDPAQDNFLVGLARGGMRAITGLIGKRNQANYKVTTNTATVGIRGSSFNLAYNADGTLSVATEQDAIEVCTAAGCVGLTAGESATVPNNQTLPIRTDVRTSMPTAPYRQDPIVAGNQVNENGTALFLPATPPEPEGPRVFTGIAFAGAGLSSGEGNYPILSLDGALTVQGGRPTAYLGNGTVNEGQVEEGGTVTVHHTQGSLAGGDYLVLGTWSGTTWNYDNGESASTTNYAPLAFVAGVPTPDATISSMAGSGMRGTYSLRQASPVYSSIGPSGTLLSATLGVDFTAGNGDVALGISMPYGGSSKTYDMTGTIQTTVGASGFQSYNLSTSGEGAYANGYLTGFFSGANAQNAGISYNANTEYNGDIAGAAILGRDALVTRLTGPYSIVFGGIDSCCGTNLDYGTQGDLYVDQANSSKVYSFSDYYGDSLMLGGSSGATTLATRGTPGSSNFMLLGVASSASWDYGESSYSAPAAFVTGAPTSSATLSTLTGLGMTGTYTYGSGQGSATPIYTRAGPNGTLNSATLGIDFTTSSGTLDMNMTLPSGYGSSTYSMSGSVGSGGPGFEGSVSGGGASADVKGFIGGTSASYAGIGYSGTNSYTDFSGAAILDGGPGAPATPPSSGAYATVTSTFVGNFTTGGNSLAVGGFPLSISGGVHTFDGVSMTDVTIGSSGSPGYAHIYGTNSEFGHLYNTGDNDFIGWGRWDSGTATSYGGQMGAVNNVHYIVGTPTPNINTLTGTVSYNLAGGTTPTSSFSGATNGQLSSASLTANFDLAKVSASVTARFDVAGSATYANATVNNMTINGNATFNGTNGPSAINGLFVGDYAARAGLTFQTTDATLGTVSGAAVFNKQISY